MRLIHFHLKVQKLLNVKGKYIFVLIVSGLLIVDEMGEMNENLENL
jgi:hypothetical protein